MKLILPILGYAAAAYFLVATFVPRVRPRWGISWTYWWTRSDAGQTRRRLPVIGPMSCLGLFLFIGSLMTFIVWGDRPAVDAWATRTWIVGFILVAVGRMFAGPAEVEQVSSRRRK